MLNSLFAAVIKNDDCAQSVDWNPVLTAQSSSTFAGLFAGFVFASIIVILTNRDKIDVRSADAARALKLLLSAFFSLAIVAYLNGIVRGEQVCRRAEAESVFNAAELAVGAIVVMIALSWLVLAFDRHDSGVLGYFRQVVMFGTAFVVLLLLSSSINYIRSSIRGGHTATYGTMIAFTAASVLAILAIPTWRRLHAREADGSMPADKIAARLDRRVLTGAWTSLLLCVVFATASSVGASLAPQFWYPTTPHWVIYATAWSTLIGPAVVIVFCILALARIPDSPKPVPASPPVQPN